jgi:hypothetical protein
MWKSSTDQQNEKHNPQDLHNKFLFYLTTSAIQVAAIGYRFKRVHHLRTQKTPINQNFFLLIGVKDT